MYLFHCKFTIFLIVWCYANTVNCTPVTLENKIKLNFGDGSSMLTDDFQSEGNADLTIASSDKIVAVADDNEKLDTDDKKVILDSMKFKDESELILQTDSFDTVVRDSTSTQESTDIGNLLVVPPPDELPKNEASPQDKPSTSNEASPDDQTSTNVEGSDDTSDSTSVKDSQTSQNMDLTDTISTPDMPDIVATGTELADPLKSEGDALITQLDSFSNPETSGQPTATELDTNIPGKSELDVPVPEISDERTATGLDIVSKTNTLELEKDVSTDAELASPDSKILQVIEVPLEASADTVNSPNTSELDVSAIDDLDRDAISSDTTLSDTTLSDTTLSDTTLSDTTLSDTTLSDTTLSDTTLSDTTLSDTTLSDTTLSDTTLSDTTLSDTTLSDTTLSDTTLSDTTLSDTTLSDTTLSDTTLSDTTSSDTTSSDTTSLDTSSPPNISEEPTATILDTSTPNMLELDETVTVKYGDLDDSNNPEISESTATTADNVPNTSEIEGPSTVTSSNMNGDKSITSLDPPTTTKILEELTTTALDEATTTTDTLNTPKISEEPTADIVTTPNTSELDVPSETTPNMSGDVVGDKSIIFDSPNSPDEQTTSESDVAVMPETLETPETPIIEDKVNTPEVSSPSASDQDTSKSTDTVGITSPQTESTTETVGTDKPVISGKQKSNSGAGENGNENNPITSTDNRYDFDMDDLDEFLKYPFEDLEDPEDSEITSVENTIIDELEKSVIEAMKAGRTDLLTKYGRTKANYKHPDEVINCNCDICSASNDFDFIDAFEPDREFLDLINSNIGRFNNNKYNSFGQKSYDIVDVDGDFLEQ